MRISQKAGELLQTAVDVLGVRGAAEIWWFCAGRGVGGWVGLLWGGGEGGCNDGGEWSCYSALYGEITQIYPKPRILKLPPKAILGALHSPTHGLTIFEVSSFVYPLRFSL